MSAYRREEKTDEHIIPDALRGTLVIVDGACRKCAEHSNDAYENTALNLDLQIPRRLLELKSSKRRGRGKKVPKPLPPVAVGNATMDAGAKFEMQLRDHEYPRIFSLLMFPPAGLLSGVDRGSTLTSVALQVFNLGGGRGRADNVTLKAPMKNGPFAMTIAKIGYCFAVAEKTLDGFDGEQIRDLLAGHRDDVYNFVGGASVPETLSNRHLHGLYMRRRGDWWTTLVHLFASCDADQSKPSTPYEVVVGKVIT